MMGHFKFNLNRIFTYKTINYFLILKNELLIQFLSFNINIDSYLYRNYLILYYVYKLQVFILNQVDNLHFLFLSKNAMNKCIHFLKIFFKFKIKIKIIYDSI